MRLRQGSMVECGWRVGELVWRKGLRVLRLDAKRIDILEVVVGAESVRIEAVELGGGCDLASMDPALGGG